MRGGFVVVGELRGEGADGVLVADPGLSEHDHPDAAGGVVGRHALEVIGVAGIGLEADGTDLLVVPPIRGAKVALVDGQDRSKGEEVGLVKLPDLEASVGAEVEEDVEAAVQGVLLLGSSLWLRLLGLAPGHLLQQLGSVLLPLPVGGVVS